MKKADAEALKQGSSPLTRGKQTIYTPAELAEGLIPAHAGKTSSSAGTSSTAEAHPRSRGENGRRMTAAERRVGSSPLTRGKRGLLQ